MVIVIFGVSLLIAVLAAQQAVNFMEPRRSGWALTAAFLAALVLPFLFAFVFDIPLYGDEVSESALAQIVTTGKNLFILTIASATLTVLAFCGMETILD